MSGKKTVLYQVVLEIEWPASTVAFSSRKCMIQPLARQQSSISTECLWGGGEAHKRGMPSGYIMDFRIRWDMAAARRRSTAPDPKDIVIHGIDMWRAVRGTI